MNPRGSSGSIFSSQYGQNRHKRKTRRANLNFQGRQEHHARSIKPTKGASRRRPFGAHPANMAAAKRSSRARQREDINRASAMSEANGGAERDRTADPLLAKQVLSQLSYSPIQRFNRTGLAQPAPATFNPKTSTRTKPPQNPASKKQWWAREDLNFRPHAYQACALTN